ncbi:MAG TPA: PQQ-dependent sugar dehydrogenase [Thermoanaerobaculia bacterium]|nr:PQQ-dependent sugar dehydrogenase [Thermoanaerobaculia bacterium]
MRLAAVAFLLASTAAAQQVALEQIASGLEMPVAITNAGDSRLFFTLQRGQIVVWDGTRVLPTPFLDIRPLVFCCGEQGLLSVAFHPRYRENGFFYVYYLDRNSDINIARYSVSSDRNRADPNSSRILLTMNHRQFGNHNGGQLQFGPDGYLYAGTGDGGGAGDPLDNGQNLSSPLAKLLRIDVDSAFPYAIPPSNPFHNEIWAFGLRNPWRFSFDRLTGDLWIADVGQGAWEEVDFQPATSIGGENYGWHLMEGKHCFRPSTNCNNGTLTLPIAEYDHSDGSCSITGGYRYRGARFPRLQGLYIYGDYCNGGIWAVMQQGNGWTVRQLLAKKMAITTFGEDSNGELYVADYGSGTIDRIIDELPPPSKRRAAAHH